MEHHEPAPRHRRRRSNSAVRAALDEARAAGLVQRHLLKLHHLAAQSRRWPGDALRSPGGPPEAEEPEAA
ncbi:hypothetical protein ACIOD2_32085 [Amycolatopsis sp. NPDC088138]|uniref:hypothetical protein n=1 Tax=Amycolatopsis sp. NPDC088138 TaxID=3363938 RepID=UPI003811E6C2